MNRRYIVILATHYGQGPNMDYMVVDVEAKRKIKCFFDQSSAEEFACSLENGRVYTLDATGKWVEESPENLSVKSD